MLIHYKGGKWNLSPWLIKYVQHGEDLEQYAADKEWWLDFEREWDHTTINEIIEVEYSDAQVRRFEEIENMPEDFGHAYSEYVEKGTFDSELPKSHPFRVLEVMKASDDLDTRTATALYAVTEVYEKELETSAKLATTMLALTENFEVLLSIQAELESLKESE